MGRQLERHTNKNHHFGLPPIFYLFPHSFPTKFRCLVPNPDFRHPIKKLTLFKREFFYRTKPYMKRHPI